MCRFTMVQFTVGAPPPAAAVTKPSDSVAAHTGHWMEGPEAAAAAKMGLSTEVTVAAAVALLAVVAAAAAAACPCSREAAV